ncbi:hypothetical protein ASPCAL11735 [Aspergillus calidoustus]|uniref:Uncharacterized protein n=1 Tax=Aspergillus calidoustus TaxID=454130 RepID=A0A0U5CEV1_ASPCI|nr:hypothetical protein ASPCAL11735 [Aspergillus calidoustus]
MAPSSGDPHCYRWSSVSRTQGHTATDYSCLQEASKQDARSLFLLSQVGDDVEATQFLETIREDIDLADIIFCSQRLDDLYGSSQTACEVDKQYASYLIGILVAAVEKFV